MRRKSRLDQASVKLGFVIALAIASAGAAIYLWKFAPPERGLTAELAEFEVRRETDETRTPPVREALAATIVFSNAGDETATIAKARFLVSAAEDLSIPRSWSRTKHRDSMLLDLKLAPGESISRTFVIPWTGREETLYFPDGAEVHLGFSITVKAHDGEPVTLSERFGSVVQRRGLIEKSNMDALVIAYP